MTLQLTMAALTNKGRVRANNEDSMYADVADRVAIVCDGMGGHAGGHIASEVAVQSIASALHQLKPQEWLDEELVIEALKQATFGANDLILDRAKSDPELAEMGTTLVACAFMHDRVITANVGDSRIYRVVDGTLEQVSSDHSLVAERVRAGLLDPDSDEAAMLANIITRALGMEQITVDITVEELQAGDIYLLCSDGLCDMLSDADILQIIVRARTLDDACFNLVDQANRNGGVDNITVALIRAD